MFLRKIIIQTRKLIHSIADFLLIFFWHTNINLMEIMCVFIKEKKNTKNKNKIIKPNNLKSGSRTSQFSLFTFYVPILLFLYCSHPVLCRNDKKNDKQNNILFTKVLFTVNIYDNAE